jgi:adenylate cyclase class 2
VLWQHSSGPATLSYTEPALGAHRRTNREIEVKLRVLDGQEMHRKLHRLGATYEGRVLERNTLYDTPDSDLRRRGTLLRIRVEIPAPSGRRLDRTAATQRRHTSATATRTILTSKAKAPASPGTVRPRRYKEKLEREVVVRNPPARWHKILRSLGLRPSFRYEKYRTTYRLSHLALDLDETPAGTFLELEGHPSAIDRAARALGYAPRDYYRGTYWDLYVSECRRRGRTPRNMVFRAQNSL